MYKKQIISALIVVLALVAGFSLMAKNGAGVTGPSMTSPTDIPNQETGETKNTKYIEYEKTAFEKVTGGRRVLFFYANWCPTCRPADADFRTNSQLLPEDVTVIRINYNDTETDQDEKELAEKYGVTYQHTFVQIDALGNELTKWNGGQVKELLVKIKK